MRLFILFVTISYVLFSLPSISQVDIELKQFPRVYDCYKTESTITLNGSLSDPAWENAKWSVDFNDIEGHGKASPYFNTKMKMLWDDEYLYIAAELKEKHIWANLINKDDIIYQDNDFEVFFDPDDDGLNYYEIEVNALGTVLDLFMNKPYNKKGKADLAWDCYGLMVKIGIEGTINNPTDTDKQWVVEMAIPWKGFGRPEPGNYWRMNFSRVQWETCVKNGEYIKKTNKETGKPLPENNWVWSPQGLINMHVPEKWGYVYFKEQLPEFWIWIGGHKNKTDVWWDSTFKRLYNTGITGALVNADTSLLKRIIPIAENNQIQVHAWFWTMNRGDAREEWLSVNRNGESLSEKKAYVDYYKFMCPALPEVKNFLSDKVKVLSEVEGLKGIHMDYIRYVDAILPIGLQPKYNLLQDKVYPEFDYGYHPYMCRLFEEKTGLNPIMMEDAATNPEWLQFRLNQLEETVAGLRDFVSNEGLDISAAVFPTPQMAREMVRQGWDTWNLDYYFPMVYHNFYNQSFDWIKEVMKVNKASLPGHTKVFCGLYLPSLQNSEELLKAVESAYEGGADGIAFFSLGSLNNSLVSTFADIINKHKQKP